jgi:hypothetical protein
LKEKLQQWIENYEVKNDGWHRFLFR